MFWKKTPTAPKEMRAVKKNELTVRMKDGETLSWAIDNWKGTNRLEPWLGFYKWFFGRGGETFVMRYDCGETMFRRADIMRFTVHVYTKEIASIAIMENGDGKELRKR